MKSNTLKLTVKALLAIVLIVVVLVGLCLPVMAADFNNYPTKPFTVIQSGAGGWTNGTASAAQGVITRIDCRGAGSGGTTLEFKVRADGATTDNQTVWIGRNTSGSTGSTNIEAAFIWAVAASGNTTKIATTNLPNMYPYYYILTTSNAAASAIITNYSITAYPN